MSELNVAPIGAINNTLEVKGPQKQDKAQEGSFSQWLTRSLTEVSELQDASDAASQKLITG